MPKTINPALEAQAKEFSYQVLSTPYGSEPVPVGWIDTEGTDYDFINNPDLVEAFDVGARYLATTDFGKYILEDWRDERASYKEDDKSYSTADFLEDLGYLENYTGRNLLNLMKYYLSSRGIKDGAWLHDATFTSDDGKYRALTFVPLSFREHDGWMWFEEITTNSGFAISHDIL